MQSGRVVCQKIQARCPCLVRSRRMLGIQRLPQQLLSSEACKQIQIYYKYFELVGPGRLKACLVRVVGRHGVILLQHSSLGFRADLQIICETCNSSLQFTQVVFHVAQHTLFQFLQHQVIGKRHILVAIALPG